MIMMSAIYPEIFKTYNSGVVNCSHNNNPYSGSAYSVSIIRISVDNGLLLIIILNGRWGFIGENSGLQLTWLILKTGSYL